MYVKELWRYPVKSMAGERVERIVVGKEGLARDRQVLVGDGRGRIVTARTHPGLLGLRGTVDAEGVVRISGHRWDSAEALELVKAAAGGDARLLAYAGDARFDVLPLLVATDGAIAHMGFDGRRLRPNLVVGGVEGLAEREWEGRPLQAGEALLLPEQLRVRCVMTTYDPDTPRQDLTVLRRIVKELGGTMGLDTSVIRGGVIRVGDAVELRG